MPSTEMVLEGLQSIASTFVGLAVVQHVLLLIVLVWARRERGISGKILSIYFGVTAALVATLAWVQTANPFNALVFLGVAVAFFATTTQNDYRPRVSSLQVWTGYAVAFIGFWYPHFVSGYWQALVSSPYGLLPCPTIMVMLGLIYSGIGRFSSKVVWVLSAVGIFYGLKGVFQLHVLIDFPLILISILATVPNLKELPLFGRIRSCG